jgi:hypothetical protein
VSSLNEAIIIAEKLGNKCYGITQTKSHINPKNCRYSVRTGELIKNGKVVASWTKSNVDKPIKNGRGRPKKFNLTEYKYKKDRIKPIKLLPIICNGIEYYHNKNTNIMYDSNTGKIIGNYINGKVKPL